MLSGIKMRVGDIIHIFAENTKPPKDKFIIIIGVSEEKIKYLSVFINSEINTNVYRSSIQQDLCIPIKQEDYPNFLVKDSFIDLNSPQEIDKKKVDWVVKNRPDAYKGTLKEEELKNCRKLIHSNRIISGKKCRQYGFFED